jgi:hypothetical protein
MYEYTTGQICNMSSLVSAAGQKPLLETDVYTGEKGEVNKAYRQTDVEYSTYMQRGRQTAIQRAR